MTKTSCSMSYNCSFLDRLMLLSLAFTCKCELLWHTFLTGDVHVTFSSSCCNKWLPTLFCDGIDWDVNLTTFGILHSIGPALHFWYSVLQLLLFCKCNARCCLKNLLQIGQFNMITYTGFPMLAMDANFRKMTQSHQILQSQ